jgi:DNA polymerase-3 subunit alpha (Gram-positive type)
VHFYAVFFSIRTAVFDIETIAKGYDAILFKIRNYERSCREKDPNLKTKDHDLFPIYQVALEFYARGFKMSNINLEKSKANIYVVEGNTIIPPFTSLDGLGSAVAETIIAARKIKQFTSKKDLIERTKINRTQAAKLEEMGVLDSIKGRDIMCGSLFDD